MNKEPYCILASSVLILAGVAFGVAGFIVDPKGQISDSVLILIAQCFIMAGSFVGIDALILRTVKHTNKSIKNKTL